jgi:hypothetical protein
MSSGFHLPIIENRDDDAGGFDGRLFAQPLDLTMIQFRFVTFQHTYLVLIPLIGGIKIALPGFCIAIRQKPL